MKRQVFALLEASSGFVMHRRPDSPRDVTYPGKVHFFGGEVLTGAEDELYDLMRGAVYEATDFLMVRASTPEHILWEGPYTEQNKQGEPALRMMYLFGVQLQPSDEVRVRPDTGGEALVVPSDIEALNAMREEFAPFAFEALSTYISQGAVIIGENRGA